MLVCSPERITAALRLCFRFAACVLLLICHWHGVVAWEKCSGITDAVPVGMWTHLREIDMFQTFHGSFSDQNYLETITETATELMNGTNGDANLNYGISPAFECLDKYDMKLNHPDAGDKCPLSIGDPPWLKVEEKFEK